MVGEYPNNRSAFEMSAKVRTTSPGWGGSRSRRGVTLIAFASVDTMVAREIVRLSPKLIIDVTP